MEELKERQHDVQDEELEKLAELYKKMNPTNKYLTVSVSNLLLASQEAAQEEKAG